MVHIQLLSFLFESKIKPHNLPLMQTSSNQATSKKGMELQVRLAIHLTCQNQVSLSDDSYL